MRDLIVPEVEDPGRFFPEPVLVEAPKFRRVDGRVEVWSVRKGGRWSEVHPICEAIAERLGRGLPFAEVVATLPEFPDVPRRFHARTARKFLWNLHKAGYVRLDLEPAPDVFAGRWRRLEELGRGGMGIVHLCEDLETGGRVVVKHAWGVKSDVNSCQRTIAIEAHVLARLDHPTAPRLVATFTDRGLLHVVRDLVDGRSLAALHKEGTRAERLDAVRQVAGGLAHVHERGFLFMDGAPGNYMRTKDGRVTAIDFGMALELEDGRVRVRGPRGTPGYVAREMYFKGPGGEIWATPRSDLFTLGRLWWWLLSGRRARRLWSEEEFHADLRAFDAPEDEKAWIERLTRDDPARRPASAREVVDGLEKLAASGT